MPTTTPNTLHYKMEDLQTSTPTFAFLPRTLKKDLEDQTHLHKEYGYVYLQQL